MSRSACAVTHGLRRLDPKRRDNVLIAGHSQLGGLGVRHGKALAFKRHLFGALQVVPRTRYVVSLGCAVIWWIVARLAWRWVVRME